MDRPKMGFSVPVSKWLTEKGDFYDTVLELPTSTIIDYHYRRLASKYNMYMCSPMVAYQMPSYSDLTNQLVDYSLEMKINFNRLVKK
jgi:hypothetical protein